MTFLTALAVVASLSGLLIGALTLAGEAGYSFDLRRRQRRLANDGRRGGRRSDDRAAAVIK